MTTMLIANNCTRESGSYMGDQLCLLKACYLFVENTPNIDKVLMSCSRSNEMHFVWEKFIQRYNIEVIWDDWNAGDWESRWAAWDKWQSIRHIDDRPFDVMKQCYLRIHGAQRQTQLCGREVGLGRRNIYSYWWCGQEHCPDELPSSVDWFDDTLMYHPPHVPTRDVYISPHCKTQGNVTFTFDYWSQVVHRLIEAGVTVTVGYDGAFCEDLDRHPLYKKHWGDHRQWMDQLCMHKLVACGNTGTGWLAAACGIPLITMEPHNSVMADHRYRECGLRNLVEVIDGHLLDSMGNDMAAVAEYCAARIVEELRGVKFRRSEAAIRASYNVKVMEACRASAAVSVNPPGKLRLVADTYLKVATLPGDVADVGAYRGGVSVILRRLAPDKHLHLFDTWTGNPHDDYLCHHKKGEWPASLDDCKALVGEGELMHYHQGVFPDWDGDDRHDDNYRPAAGEFFCFVYVDPDTYQTVKAAIEFFWPRMVPGGMMVFDDYGWTPCAGVKKAVDEAFTEEQRRVVKAHYTCIVEK